MAKVARTAAFLARFTRSLLLLTLMSSGVARAESHLILWGGGTTPALGEAALTELEQAPFRKRLVTRDGYPRVEDSSRVPGLRPGFFVVVLGACAKKRDADRAVGELRALALGHGGKSGVYTRSIPNRRPEACPVTVQPPPCDDDEECRQACDGGAADACDALADRLHKAKAERALITAARLRACDLGSADACAIVAGAVRFGLGVPKDEVRASALLSKACELGSGDGCRALAIDHQNARRSDDALRLYTRACKLGNADACRDAAELSPPSPTSRAALQQACDAGDPAACATLAALYARGEGGPRDIKRARDLEERACELGEVNVCCRLGRGCP